MSEETTSATNRQTIKVQLQYLADVCEKDWGYCVDTPFDTDTRYAFRRSAKGRRNRFVVEQFANGKRVGVYDAPAEITILD